MNSRIAPLANTLIWGDITAYGPSSIESWMRNESSDMDGTKPDSLDTLIVETPVISLSTGGTTAKGRWNGLRNVDGKGVPLVPYHFTAKGSGVPVSPAEGDAPQFNVRIEQLEARIQRMNEEDAVRNIIHARGYYVNRRLNAFRNRIVKEDRIWKVQDVVLTRPIFADCYIGWGNGGGNPSNPYILPFLDITNRETVLATTARGRSNTTVDDLELRLRRSAAYNCAEN
ncbi:hypothetical protein EJ02DRAFT_469800 [Clathrospora elynae]|uniref:Uncharacterized protein n=1 Tax=Clathrospora elynae TaxID=706981 RepID=A0A6A5SC89_9PLEO|nr:hypothetical protein EJ02DRAFT_469800 [Clathrospora elynae]